MTFELSVASGALLILLASAYYMKHHAKTPSNTTPAPIAPETQTAAEPTAEAEKTEQTEASEAPATKPALTISPISDALRETMNKALANMSDCQAIAYVDIRENRLIGVQSSVAFPDEIVALTATTTTELFTTPSLIKISHIFKQFKGQVIDQSNFNEMVIRGIGTAYIFLRARSDINHVCVFACIDVDEQNSNFGLLLHQARLQMSEIEVAAEAAFLVE